MRALVLLPLVLIAGCDRRSADEKTVAAVESAQQKAAEDDGAIACARAGQTELRRDCLIERTNSAAGLVLTVRHPDGAFRRLLVTGDGRGVVAADGAEAARVKVLGKDRIEVTVAGDRYQLPATVKGGGAGQ